MKSKKRKSLGRLIRKLILLAAIIILVIVGRVVMEGYDMYKQAVNKISIEDRVKEIQNSKGYTKIADIPKDYTNAVIAIEDHRFRQHSGIDYIATSRAVLRDIKAGELAEGGSTITQQLAKNMYFTQEKRFERKVAELFVAFKLEKEYSKDDIIEMYMNVAYFGRNYYGVGNACRGYFKKEPINMTMYESTLLAGIPNAPGIYALDANPDLAEQRQEQVLDCMVKYNYISEDESKTVMNKNK